MIVLLFLNLIGSVLGAIFFILPNVDVLPFGIDPIVQQGAGYVAFLCNLVPPLGYLVDVFVFYLGFLLLLKAMKLIPIIRRIFDKKGNFSRAVRIIRTALGKVKPINNKNLSLKLY